MPFDIQQVMGQISQMVVDTQRLNEAREQKRAIAWALFNQYADEIDALEKRLELVIQSNKLIRCAVPFEKPFNRGVNLPKIELPPFILLAADGSQMNASRHYRVEFGLINISLLCSRPLEGVVESPRVMSELVYHNPPHTPDSILTDEMISLHRDVSEREVLAQAAVEKKGKLTFALTDGSLELFHEPKDDDDFRELFGDYLDAMLLAAEVDCTPAGYVDKPGANMVVSMLELMLLGEDEINQRQYAHPLSGVSDAYLFGEILSSGQRSAVFQLQSSSAQKFKDKDEQLALHFFYLNVGDQHHPALARVEIPFWVAANPQRLEQLHVMLMAECRKLGTRPYPYLLHRAHEEALVGFQDRKRLEDMIVQAMLQNSLLVGEMSNKQANKSISSTPVGRL